MWEVPTLFSWNSSAPAEGGSPGWDEPLASDRPDFTEASSTVGRGVRQVEMGYTYVHAENDGTTIRAHSYPETLFRIGVLADWLELRAAFNFFHVGVDSAAGPTKFSGGDDLYLGMKLALTQQQGILPEMALMPQMFVPVGHDAFSADRVLPGLNWLYGWDINDFLSFAGSTQANAAVDDTTGSDYVIIAQSLTTGFTLTERLGAYTEWFVLGPHGADTVGTQHYLNGGFTFRVTNNLQFDIRAGMGLSQASDDFFGGSGMVVRF